MYVTGILLLVAPFLKTARFWQKDAKKVEHLLSGHAAAFSPACGAWASGGALSGRAAPPGFIASRTVDVQDP